MFKTAINTGIFILFTLIIPGQLISQDVVIDEEGFETFSMTEGDSTYTMKKYFMVFLKKGEKRDQSPEESAKIQSGHMAHMNTLAEAGKISIAGPFGDDGEVRGIVIYNINNIEEVQKLVAEDPAVIAGRLVMEIHPFWAAQGSTLQ